jgi:hyperosmotically inducible protein
MRKVASFAVSLTLSLNTAFIAASGAAPNADNSAQNNGVLSREAVTAQKQKSAKDQVTVLAEIRKSILAEKGLSVNAQNVKILYSKGIIILRGPVDSEEEKATVEQLVKHCDAVGAVRNQLTVTAKKQ